MSLRNLNYNRLSYPTLSNVGYYFMLLLSWILLVIQISNFIQRWISGIALPYRKMTKQRNRNANGNHIMNSGFLSKVHEQNSIQNKFSRLSRRFGMNVHTLLTKISNFLLVYYHRTIFMKFHQSYHEARRKLCISL